MAGDGTVLQDGLFAFFSSIPQPDRRIRQTLFASVFLFSSFGAILAYVAARLRGRADVAQHVPSHVLPLLSS